LFGVVMIGCGAMFVVAPFVGWWMPAAVSSHGQHIDDLFYWILAITGFFFVLTEALLVGFMYRYVGREPGETLKPSLLWNLFKPLASMFNTASKIEMAWTVVPAVILLWLAFAQIGAWKEVKYKSRLDADVWGSGMPVPVQMDISARQFEWRMRFPSPATWEKWKTNPKLAQEWARKPEFDDIFLVNELHAIKERHVVINLSTKDVIHSFNMPHMRVKQDALPGKTIPVWFKPTASNCVKNSATGHWDDGGGRDPLTGAPKDTTLVWEIACAELCGWGHYRMIGRSYIHDTEADFVEWLKSAAEHQSSYGQPTAPKK
jgi:cytochrome c oxidase subunit 2